MSLPLVHHAFHIHGITDTCNGGGGVRVWQSHVRLTFMVEQTVVRLVVEIWHLYTLEGVWFRNEYLHQTVGTHGGRAQTMFQLELQWHTDLLVRIGGIAVETDVDGHIWYSIVLVVLMS
jgi:hypothetical protein